MEILHGVTVIHVFCWEFLVLQKNLEFCLTFFRTRKYVGLYEFLKISVLLFGFFGFFPFLYKTSQDCINKIGSFIVRILWKWSCHVIRRYAMLCDATRCCAMLCDAMRCYAMLRLHVMIFLIILYGVRTFLATPCDAIWREMAGYDAIRRYTLRCYEMDHLNSVMIRKRRIRNMIFLEVDVSNKIFHTYVFCIQN